MEKRAGILLQQERPSKLILGTDPKFQDKILEAPVLRGNTGTLRGKELGTLPRTHSKIITT